ncbi:MAG TPA: hypothetical protein ENN69_02990, partial [Spirochaetia bacterium]|nr:hypothetical protein [Spirochaetia bacterium]
MGEEKWIKVASIDELQEHVPKKVSVDGTELMVIVHAGKVFAVKHACPHYGAPLEEGLVHGTTITCPWHNASFDYTNGALLLPPALDGLPVYPTTTEDGAVLVRNEPVTIPPRKKKRAKETVVILGGGAAGNSAAETLRREGYDGRVVMVSRESDLPYDRPNLSKDFLAGKAKPEWIPLRSHVFYQDREIDLLLNHDVVKVEPEERRVLFRDRGALSYDKLCVATGGIPRRSDIPGNNLEGVFLLRSLDDARRIIAWLDDIRSVCIVGAGFIGMEAAAALSTRGMEVHVVAPEPLPLSLTLGETAGRWLLKLHESKNVRFHLGNTVTRFRGNDHVEAVELSSGEKIKTQGVILGLGITPAVDAFSHTALVHHGVVPVNAKMETALPDIYAAGDIAQLRHPVTGELERVEHWAVAERQGQ